MKKQAQKQPQQNPAPQTPGSRIARYYRLWMPLVSHA